MAKGNKKKKIAGLLCDPPASPYRVPDDGSFRISRASTRPPKRAPQGKKGKSDNKKVLAAEVDTLYDLQRKLYADNRYAVLLVFQAMDAAGKDGTIRAVLTGINPAGFQTFTFKKPSLEELDHDFLWRVHRRAPERGRIGVFNRSHYEEVLIVRVNKLLGSRHLPRVPKDVWSERLQAIADWEKHLAQSGTLILKFFLHVSRDEQRERLLARLNDPAKNWKFESGDLDVRDQWGDYMDAYEKAINATSTPWAPWYAIPADDKYFMRHTVATIVRKGVESLPLRWPELHPDEVARIDEWRARLESD